MAYGALAEKASDLTDPVAGLQAVATLRRVTDELELAQVEAGLRAGLSWPEIAEALGVSRQAVHKKFRKRMPPELLRSRGEA